MNEWKEYKLGEIVDFNKTSINKDFPYDQIEYLDTGSVTEGNIYSYQILRITEAPSRARRLVQPNDIIYSTVRPIQRHYAILRNPKPNTVVSTGFAVITSKQNIHSDYLYYYSS